jgi:hypothetical protein
MNNILVSSMFDTGNIELQSIKYEEKETRIQVRIEYERRNVFFLNGCFESDEGKSDEDNSVLYTQHTHPSPLYT